MIPKCIFLILISITISSALKDSNGIEITITKLVQTDKGYVRGKREETQEGNAYFGFRSIPYAKPPLGELRFRPSEPAEPWQGVLDAKSDGPACLQVPAMIETGTVGEEDCLWLSVFTPRIQSLQVPEGVLPDVAQPKIEEKPFEPMPVLVWIHGGRYIGGTARTQTYSPEYMMEQGDIVMVSIQYRLGALGFLSTEDEVAPGNYGLWDQNLALKWIQNNIKNFGGDPNRVTIAGHSAGGTSAHGHMFSAHSKELFHQAISFSGTANMAWATMVPARSVAMKQAKLLGCPMTPSKELISCLRQVDAHNLTASQADLHHFFKHTSAKLPLSMYLARNDKEAELPFFAKGPRKQIRTGGFNVNIPWLTGVTNMEGAWYVPALMEPEKGPEMVEELNKAGWVEALEYMTAHLFGHVNLHQMAEFYFQNQPLDIDKHRVRLSEFFSDMLFNFDWLFGIHQHVKRSQANTFAFRFDYRGNWTFAHKYDTKNDYGGVAHVDDIRYFMKLGFAPELNEEEKQMMKLYTDYISQFVKTGQPHKDIEQWPPFKQNDGHYMAIGGPDSTELRHDVPFDKDRMLFWAKNIWNIAEDVLADYKDYQNGNAIKEEL